MAKRRVARIQRILSEIGLEPERVAMVNVSSAMGSQFAEAATEVTERTRSLGPNPFRSVANPADVSSKESP